MKTAIYGRVSTSDQSVDLQTSELREVAERSGWEISDVFLDEGVSGAKSRVARDGLRRLLIAVTRREITRIMVWSVDRLGRSLKDLVEIMGEINAAGCELYIHKQAIDTATPQGRMMFGLISVFAEFEREMIRERVKSGLREAKNKGKKLGRKPFPKIRVREILKLRSDGLTVKQISEKSKISTATINRMLRKGIDDSSRKSSGDTLHP